MSVGRNEPYRLNPAGWRDDLSTDVDSGHGGVVLGPEMGNICLLGNEHEQKGSMDNDAERPPNWRSALSPEAMEVSRLIQPRDAPPPPVGGRAFTPDRGG